MSVDTHDSPHSIIWSTGHTLGVEQELHTVTAADAQLAPGAAVLIRRLGRSAAAQYVHDEYMANTVEVTTPVCQTAGQAVATLRRLRQQVDRMAERLGLMLSPLSTHPIAEPREQAVTDTPRYQRAVQREGLVGRETQNIGVHVHVGVTSGEAAVAALDQLAIHLPLFIALTASSPYWRGEDTGFESYRCILGDRLPPSGAPPHFQRWADFTTWYDAMKSGGYVSNLTDIWWDVRVSRYGTVELRVADGVATDRELAGVIALAQCLVARVEEPGFERRHLPADMLRMNRWEAARFGQDAEIALSVDVPQRRSIRDHLNDVVDDLMPTARRLGCATELASLRALAQAQSSARRQRAVAAASGDLTAVVRAGVTELRTNRVAVPGHRQPGPGRDERGIAA